MYEVYYSGVLLLVGIVTVKANIACVGVSSTSFPFKSLALCPFLTRDSQLSDSSGMLEFWD